MDPESISLLASLVFRVVYALVDCFFLEHVNTHLRKVLVQMGYGDELLVPDRHHKEIGSVGWFQDDQGMSWSASTAAWINSLTMICFSVRELRYGM